MDAFRWHHGHQRGRQVPGCQDFSDFAIWAGHGAGESRFASLFSATPEWEQDFLHHSMTCATSSAHRHVMSLPARWGDYEASSKLLRWNKRICRGMACRDGICVPLLVRGRMMTSCTTNAPTCSSVCVTVGSKVGRGPSQPHSEGPHVAAFNLARCNLSLRCAHDGSSSTDAQVKCSSLGAREPRTVLRSHCREATSGRLTQAQGRV